MINANKQEELAELNIDVCGELFNKYSNVRSICRVLAYCDAKIVGATEDSTNKGFILDIERNDGKTFKYALFNVNADY